MAEQKQEGNPLDKLAGLGITPEQAQAFLSPLIEKAVERNLAAMKLPDLLNVALDNKFKAYTEQVEKLLAQREASQGQAPPQGARQGGGITPEAVAGFMRLFSGGGGMGGLTELSQMGKAFGEVMKNVLEPISDIYDRGRKDAYSQIATIGKGGGAMPWESQGGSKSSVPTGPTATLNQADIASIADEVARRITVRG